MIAEGKPLFWIAAATQVLMLTLDTRAGLTGSRSYVARFSGYWLQFFRDPIAQFEPVVFAGDAAHQQLAGRTHLLELTAQAGDPSRAALHRTHLQPQLTFAITRAGIIAGLGATQRTR